VTVVSPPVQTVRILHVEDDPRDADLVLATLESGGLRVVYRRVDTREGFVDAVRSREAHAIDAILSDFALPTFDGASALRIARDLAPELPFIFVSGTLGEDAAVEGLRMGADDYVLKDRLTKLPSAVVRAIHQHAERRRLRQAEAQLQASEERFRRFMEATPMLAFLRDAAGRHLYANRAACEFFGRPESELVGRTVHELFPTDAAYAMEAAAAEVVRTGRSTELVLAVPAPAGGPRSLSGVTFPLRDVSGQLLVAAVLLDVTEKQQLEARYLHAQKLEAVGRLAGGVAHDFNNLLTIITGYSQMIEAARGKDPVLGTYLSEIRAAADRAAVLTRQLLAFSRQEVVQPVVLSVNETLGGIERMVRRLVGEEVRLEIELAPTLPAVRMDRGQLEQVVMNLVVNARDATQAGGLIRIATSQIPWERVPNPGEGAAQGPYVVLTVADNGSGMTAETQSRVFEPFFTTKERGKGTGLGLATVHGIVKQAGGQVALQSTTGVGTTFDVYLPAVHESAQQPAPSADAASPGGGRETVLVVEDSPPVRSLVARILGGAGYHVLEAEDGVDAVERLRAAGTRVHLLITDIVMPRMGGAGLAETIATLQPDCRVLFLSGYADHESARRVDLRAGRALLRKPFNSGDLLHKVRELLDE
jgi:two-component system, cell cycle sensor histidine kinase and response regulator CckA